QIVEIRDLIRELGREKTVILSTHILPEVQASCDRIMIISGGRMVADDTPEMLSGGGDGAVVRVVVKDTPAAETILAAVPGVVGVTASGEESGGTAFRLRCAPGADPREQIFNEAVRSGMTLIDLHRERASLEDTFRQ